MAQKTINLGTGELTGDGETLRSAFSKANDNFTELYGGAGTGILNVVEDTTPQLGGNLDMNGFEIVTTNSGHIRLDPDGTGGVGIGNVTNAATLLHLQQSAPIITLQRLDNTLSQGISWTGQNGVEAASIKLDGTGGTTNTLIMSTFDGSSVTERLRIMAASGAGIQVTGTVNGHIIPGGSGTLALTSDIPSDTDGLSEGTTNLYYTDARADARAQLKVDALVDAAPGTMDTLNELAAALGDDPNFATTTANNIAAKLPLAGGTMAGDIDGAGNKVLFANMYATEGDLPNATTYHGMFAHVHATGAGYFAHGGNWIKLANYTDLSPYLPTANLNTNIDLHLNQASATTGQYLSWNGSDYAWVGIGTGGGGGVTVQDEGSALSTAGTTLNFVGAGVTATGTGATKTITIAGGGGTGDISFSASQLSTDATTMTFKTDANNDDSGYEGYYFYGGPTSNGNVRIWVNGTGETAIKIATSNTNSAIMQKSNEFKLIGNEHSGNHPVKFYNNGNGNNAHIDLGLRHADARVRITDINASVYYVLPSATPNLGDVLTASDGSGTLAWSAPSSGSSNIISQGNSNVTVTDTGSDGTITFDTEGTDRWQFTSAGHLLPVANATYDIGSADYKVRHLFLSDNSLKFVDSSDVEYSLGVVGAKLQYQGEDILQAVSTDNVNMNVNGSGLGISIGTASTSGSTISIGAEVNNTSVNMYGVTEFGAKAIFNRGVHEKFLTITGATGVVAHNVQNGHVFYHTGAAANFTANFTNLSLAQEDATNIAIIINQGNTGYIPSAVQIGGAAQTIVWNGNSTPSATDNGTDVFSFTILNDGGTYVVLGQMVSFGGV